MEGRLFRSLTKAVFGLDYWAYQYLLLKEPEIERAAQLEATSTSAGVDKHLHQLPDFIDRLQTCVSWFNFISDSFSFITVALFPLILNMNFIEKVVGILC